MGTIKGRIKKSYTELTGKEVYFRRPVTYSTIDETELLHLASVDSQIPIATLQQIFDGIRIQFGELLLNGHTVQLGELGSFRLSVSAKSVGNAEQVSVDNIRTRRILFLPSKALKQKIESTKIQSEIVEGVQRISKMLPSKLGDLNGSTILLTKKVSEFAVSSHLKLQYAEGGQTKLINFLDDGKIKNGNEEVGTWGLLADKMTVSLTITVTAGSGPSINAVKWV